MNKLLAVILLFLSCSLAAQTKPASGKSVSGQDETSRQYQHDYKYVKQRNYAGPGKSEYVDPPGMQSESAETEDYEFYENTGGGIVYSPDAIKRAREAKQKANGGKNADGTPIDPELGQPEPIDPIDPPAADEREDSSNDVDPNADNSEPMFSSKAWMILVFILLFIALAVVIYYIVKNQQPRNRRLESDFSPENWNPILIPKTELELRLEEAMLAEDYRECVRIYFTFILKELIRLNRIKWKKDLTNLDYLLQMGAQKGYADFSESVRIYDLIWYGDYEISLAEFQAVVPHLEKNYQQLTTENE